MHDEQVAHGIDAGTLPPFIGIRVKPMSRELHSRSLRTLDLFDDAAIGQGLLNFFVRGLTSGALTVEEARETGLTLEELQGRSFLKILEGRAK